MPREVARGRGSAATLTAMKILGGAVAVTTAMIMLAGCGGTSAQAGPSPSPSSSAGSPLVQTVVPETAIPQQYASIITRNGDLKKSLAKLVDCDWLSTGRLDYVPGSFTCQFGVLSMSYQAMTLQASLEGANSPTATAYVGPPPAELAPLVSETRVNAERLGKVATRASDAECGKSGVGRCSALRVATVRAMSDLNRSLDAWQPYL